MGPSATQKSDALSFPCEFGVNDKNIFLHIKERNLSLGSNENLFATIMACRYVLSRRIEGDFVECGVWRGGQSILAASTFADEFSEKVVWMFDTFAGMTSPTCIDVDHRGRVAEDKAGSTHTNIENDWVYASLNEVKDNFSNAGISNKNLRFIEGDVSLTLREINNLPSKISFLRLDTDWYESTKLELEILYPRLSKGGVLIIDDYGHWGGARRAVDEFFSVTHRPFFQYIDYTARLAVKL